MPQPPKFWPEGRKKSWWLLLAAGYASLATVGMRFADSASHISLLSLPAGLAVAALLRFGLRLWPGVALGVITAEFVDPTALSVPFKTLTPPTSRLVLDLSVAAAVKKKN